MTQRLSGAADDLADVAEWYVEQEITATTLKSAWTNNTAPTTTVALYFALHAASLLKTHCVHMDDSTDEWVCGESNANARTTACGQECSQYEPNLVEIADELAAAEEIVEGVWAQDCFAAADTPTVIDRAVRLRAKFTA